MATAITVIVQVWRMMFSRLFRLRKPLPYNVTEKTRNTSTNAP